VNRANLPRNKARKQTEATQRATERTARSHREQLQVLDQRLGVGQGAAKERARLQVLIDAEVQAAQVAPKPAKLSPEEKAAKKTATKVAKAQVRS
jgi:hypothetical protein